MSLICQTADSGTTFDGVKSRLLRLIPMPEHSALIRETFQMRCCMRSETKAELQVLIFIHGFYGKILPHRFQIWQDMLCICCKKQERMRWLWEQADGFAADQKWFHGIEDIESVWEMMKRAGFTERQAG